jgi:major membrane immunogen (membrane-anchored lipoprotein)
MKRSIKMLVIFMLMLLLGLSGCSSKSNESKANDSSTSSKGSTNTGEMSFTENKDQKTDASKQLEVPSQMVIYQADLQLEVKNFDKSLELLEQKVQRFGGYIAESNVNREGKEQVSGNIKVRIPQKDFQSFLHEAESQAAKVLQRNITGQDVTEEYVDLESRLKSKKVVEERLLSFMKNAAKTEDLLKISSDLAAVQEEIETIEGKMKYLENQTSLSTINIALYENKVPNLNNDDLNTWERTKIQFMKSTNWIITGLSSLVVFFLGNLPLLLVLFIVGSLIYFYWRKVKKGKRSE